MCRKGPGEHVGVSEGGTGGAGEACPEKQKGHGCGDQHQKRQGQHENKAEEDRGDQNEGSQGDQLRHHGRTKQATAKKKLIVDPYWKIGEIAAKPSVSQPYEQAKRGNDCHTNQPEQSEIPDQP